MSNLPEVDITTCQGIGDCFWVYKVIAPHVSGIHWNVLHAEANDPARQTRATGFLHLLPKTLSVTGRVISHQGYRRVSSGRFRLRDVLASGGGDYACNAPLEAGVRIEDIEPDYAIEETVPMRVEAAALAQPYVVGYVSGSTVNKAVRKANGLWRMADWERFFHGMYSRFGLSMPLVILGARYDREACAVLADSMRERCQVSILIDLPPARVCGILQGAACLVAYQSGLSILADNLSEAKSVMLYFPFLDGLRQSWPRRRNLESGAHQSFLMSRTPEQVLGELPWDRI